MEWSPVMANEDPTEDMVKREMQAAIEILRSDEGLKHSRSMDERLARLEARFGGDDGSGGNGDGKNPPPKKDAPADPPANKKRGLWWGDALDESTTA